MEHHRQPTRETKECEEALQRCGLLRTRYGFAAAPQLRHGITIENACRRWTQGLRAERAPSISRLDTGVRSISCFTCSKVHWAGFLSGRHLRMDVP